MSNKPAKQAWIDCLLQTIERDADPHISDVGPFFRKSRKEFEDGLVSEAQVREYLNRVRDEAVTKCRARHHAEKLFDAAIEYVINPEKILQV